MRVSGIEKLNVLYLTSYRDMGGAETHLLSLLSHGDDSIGKFLACIVKPINCSSVEILERARYLGIPSQSIVSQGKFQIRTLELICQIVKSRNIHIIHSHGYKADILGFLAARLCRRYIITTLHGWTDSTINLRLYKMFDLAILRFFDRVICVSPRLVEQTKRWGIPVPMVEMVYSGIDIGKFGLGMDKSDRQLLKKELGINDGFPVIGAVGRLSIEKGHRYLLQAAAEIRKEVPDFYLLIVGDGPLREELTVRAKGLGLEHNVIFAGYRRDIPQVLSVMDIFVQPSEREGLPITILEAAIMQKPIVASDVGAVSAVILDGKTGILVERGNVSKLAEAILLLLRDPDKGRRMGAAAGDLVKSDFNSESMFTKIMNIYHGILTQGHRS